MLVLTNMLSPPFLLLTSIVLPILSIPFVLGFSKWIHHRPGLFALLVPILSFFCIFTIGLQNGFSEQYIFSWAWIPSLGIDLVFVWDGLSVFFGLLISGVGVLIFFYASFYLTDDDKHQGRFFSYLLLFMSSMLGTVFSDHLIVLFVFWEITGISSFFLIGFNHQQENAREGARMSLLVTGLTGLCLLAGMILLGLQAETFKVSEMTFHHVDKSTLFYVTLFLILLGIFGKSAQFPFHFWLPNAMAAPTPVSAYLHSAAMVKLGVFLTARLFPLFSANDFWSLTLSSFGFVSMFIGAVQGLLSNDLKAILAYSTVSQIGFLIGMYGIYEAAKYDYFHILSHVFYKASLFMMVGVIDHALRIRDVRKLGGLARKMPVMALTCFLACAGMAALPLTTGFLSKELILNKIYKQAMAGGWYDWFILFCLGMATICLVAIAIRVFRNVFFKSSDKRWLEKDYHDVGWGIQISPFLLALAVLVFGIWNQPMEELVNEIFKSNPITVSSEKLSQWHGLTPEFYLSMVFLVLGGIVYFIGEKLRWRFTSLFHPFRFDDYFQELTKKLPDWSLKLTKWIGAQKPTGFLMMIVIFSICFIGIAIMSHISSDINWLSNQMIFEVGFFPVFTAFMIALSALILMGVVNWLFQLVLLSLIGFLIMFYFILFQAPDLALTQFFIEFINLILILLFMIRLKKSKLEMKYEKRSQWNFYHVMTVMTAVLSSVVVFFFLISFFTRTNLEGIGFHYINKSKEVLEMQNAVNAILIDFRGFDTMGEISVLVIAMLGILGLLLHQRKME